MPIYREEPHLSRRFHAFRQSFLQKGGLHFSEVLTEDRIEQVFAEAGVKFPRKEDENGVVYTPAVTLLTFCSQCLYKGEQRSCLAAVSRVLVMLVTMGRSACCKNSGDYCRARAKLPEVVFERLTEETAKGCEDKAPSAWLWHNRHVFLVDGTTAGMSDTPSNQAQYPQHKTQKEGLGFPLVRMVVLLSLANAMVYAAAVGPCSGKETGETALLRELLDRLEPGSILMGDRYYASYFMIALVLLGKCDFVTRLHQCRSTDFTKAKRLGKGDHLVKWSRPKRPEWMEQAVYDQIPETIEVRLVEVQVLEPGFRVESLMVVTTLTDAAEYPPEEIANLYRKRWLVEVYQPEYASSSGLYQLAA